MGQDELCSEVRLLMPIEAANPRSWTDKLYIFSDDQFRINKKWSFFLWQNLPFCCKIQCSGLFALSEGKDAKVNKILRKHWSYLFVRWSLGSKSQTGRLIWPWRLTQMFCDFGWRLAPNGKFWEDIDTIFSCHFRIAMKIFFHFFGVQCGDFDLCVSLFKALVQKKDRVWWPIFGLKCNQDPVWTVTDTRGRNRGFKYTFCVLKVPKFSWKTTHHIELKHLACVQFSHDCKN